MLIDKLIVRQTTPSQKVIREINFNPKGLSLIVDNTNSAADKSGNSVGKTTAIKIIDLCLGAKSVRDLYYDSDTRSENVEIRDYIHKNKLQAELIIRDSNNFCCSIKRDLFKKGKRYINDNPFTENEFNSKLKEIIFGLSQPFPTFRQLIPKFVRLPNSSEDRMIKFLPRMTRNEVYDAVYGFLFHIMDTSLVSKKNELSTQLVDCQRSITVLEKNKSISSISMLRQKQELVDADLEKLYKKRRDLSYMETYKDEINHKRKINSQISKLQEKSQLLDFEIKTIEDSLNKLENDKANIDISMLKKIYNEANRYIPKLQKTFEEVVKFHNIMIQNRIDFINQQAVLKKAQLEECSSKISELLDKKKEITIAVLDEGLLDDLNILNRQIEDLSIKKGELMQSIKLLEEQEQIKADLSEQLQKIETKIDNEKVEDKMKAFNQIFSDYCYKLYGEKYILAYNSNWKEEKKFPVTAESLGGNVGTGKKKALIVAFDLAYMKYAETMDLQFPNFVIHDKLENTHINQLKTIFKICENINGQYILPILRERIDKIDGKYVNQAIVLELSENDKFFRV